MDSGKIPPHQPVKAESEPVEAMETDSTPVPSSDQQQRYTPKSPSIPHAKQRLVSEDFDISLPLPPAACLPDKCPEWFASFQDIYDHLFQLNQCFLNPKNQKAFLNGDGFEYNLLILMLKKWDLCSDGLLTEEQVDLVEQWIESSLIYCPIEPRDIPREFNHLNTCFEPSVEDKKLYYQTKEEKAAKKLQFSDHEFIPGWMKESVILGLTPQEAFRNYWNIRNKPEHYKNKSTFLTPYKLREKEDVLYCWLIKFRDPDTGKKHGLRNDQIQLIEERLFISDETVNKAIQKKKSFASYHYTWKTMPLFGTTDDIDRRISERMLSLQNDSTPEPMSVSSSDSTESSQSRRSRKIPQRTERSPSESETLNTDDLVVSLTLTPDQKRALSHKETIFLTTPKSVRELDFLGPFDGLTNLEIQKLLDQPDIEWLIQTRTKIHPEANGEGSFPIASIKDESLDSPQSDPLSLVSSAKVYQKDKTPPELIEDIHTASTQNPINASQAKAVKTPTPEKLLNLLSLVVTPVSTDQTLSASIAIKVLLSAIEEFDRQLHTPVLVQIRKDISIIHEYLKKVSDASETKAIETKAIETKAIETKAKREELIKIKKYATPFLEQATLLQELIAQFSTAIIEQSSMFDQYEERVGSRVRNAHWTLIETELKKLIWNVKKQVSLEPLETWQKLPSTDYPYLDCTKKSLLESSSRNEQLVKSMNSLKKRPDSISVSLPVFNSVKANWKNIQEATSSECIVPRQTLAKLVIDRLREINKIYLNKMGVWNEDEGKYKYTDLATLMLPLIKAYSEILPASDSITEEYQALSVLCYSCSRFADALKSNAHTDKAGLLKKGLQEHKNAISRLTLPKGTDDQATEK